MFPEMKVENGGHGGVTGRAIEQRKITEVNYNMYNELHAPECFL
jgi:hypothetical protein